MLTTSGDAACRTIGIKIIFEADVVFDNNIVNLWFNTIESANKNHRLSFYLNRQVNNAVVSTTYKN
jgi:hypothetical protein